MFILIAIFLGSFGLLMIVGAVAGTGPGSSEGTMLLLGVGVVTLFAAALILAAAMIFRRG
jgi:hypothetical protein